MVTQCNSAEVFTLNFSPHNIWWRDTSQTKYLGPVVSSQITNNITSPSWKENDGININVVLLLARWKLKWSSRPELLKINNWTRKRKQFSPWTFYLFEVVQMQRRQTTEISDDTDCGAWPQAGEVQTPTVQQDDICHHLRRFVHHLPTICGVQWSNLSSLIYSVFLLLSCSCLWSILVQCDRGDQPRAANCPRSVNTDTGGERKYFLVDISRFSNYFLYIYHWWSAINEIKNENWIHFDKRFCREEMGRRCILHVDFAAINSLCPAPSRADNNDKCCSSSDTFCHKHSHSHHTCNTSIFYYYQCSVKIGYKVSRCL